MAELTEDECLTISRSPLEIEQLRNTLRTSLNNTAANSQATDVLPSDDDRGSDSTEADEVAGQYARVEVWLPCITRTDFKETISSLLEALQIHRVAKVLRSRESRNTINRELALLYSRIDAISAATFLPLVHAVVRRASDIEIWKQVLLLITSSSQITPPPSVSASFGGTPRTHSSASHQGSEQTKRLLYDALRDELPRCSYIKVPEFFEKYFEQRSWTQKSKDIFNATADMYSSGRWTTFPSRPTESAVWAWWSQFQADHLTDLPGSYHRTESKSEMADSDGERQLDLFVKSLHAPHSREHRWEDVRVIGEHTESNDRGKKFLQLARYARSVFSAQPRRQFVHAFILSSTKMELHVFDRSGTFSMEPFDIHEQPERFIRVISGYCMMNDEELGLDTFIERQGRVEHVTVVDQGGKNRRLQLKSECIAYQTAIVGRATSCYCSVDEESVVKFSWVSNSKSPTEPELLKLANERKVRGVPRLIGHRRHISTGELRSPLVFLKRRHMGGRQYSVDQQRSNISFSSQFASLPLSDEGKKRKPIDAQETSSKNSRSNSQTSKLNQVDEVDTDVAESQLEQASQAVDKPFIDRVLCIQATQPAGKPLASFGSIRQLLQALRDAIQVHWSLYLDGRILHRDVSETNIIITNADQNGGLSGMLIDLELGTIVENERNTRTGLKQMTGTLKYMAIEVLELGLSGARPDLEHTYRHDLESFFYVFLSICLNHGWEAGKRPKDDLLREWYAGSYDSIVGAKRGRMEPGGFDSLILRKFSPAFECVKALATGLRDVLFLRLGQLRTETPAEPPSNLYDQMISEFDKALQSLQD